MQTKEQFLQILARELQTHPKKQEIVAEWERHIYDSLSFESEEEVLKKLDHPSVIAKCYKEVPTSKRHVQRMFVWLNTSLYIVGALLTILYHNTESELIHHIWRNLIAASPLIIVLDLFLWMMIGFEIGKTYGVKGSELLKATVLYGIAPNMILMFLTLFHFIRPEWFENLLTPIFVLICTVLTCLLYPISKVAYYIGVRYSV